MTAAPDLSREQATVGQSCWCALFIGVLATFVVTKSIGMVTAWKYTAWTFDYSLGFQKRSLIGAVLHGAGGQPGFDDVVVMSLVLVIVFVGLIAFLSHQAIARLGFGTHSYVLVAVLFLSPGVLLLVADLARFDVINYVIAIASILTIFRVQSHELVIVLVASVVMLLIHEAAMVTTVPLLLLMAALKHNRDLDFAKLARSKGLILVSCCIIAGFVLVMFFGKIDVGSQEYVRNLTLRTGVNAERISEESAQIVTRDSDGLFAVLDQGAPRFKHFVTVAVYFFIQIAVMFAFFVMRMRVGPRVLGGLVLVALAPLPLFLAGIDWDRWLALISLNATLCGLLVMREGWLEKRESARPIFAALLLGLIVMSASDQYTLGVGQFGGPLANLAKHMSRFDRERGWTSAFDWDTRSDSPLGDPMSKTGDGVP